MYRIVDKGLPQGIAFTDEIMVLKIATHYSEAHSEVGKVIRELFRKSKIIAKSDIEKEFCGHTKIIGGLLLSDVDLGYLIEVEQKEASSTDVYYLKGPKYIE